MSYWARHPQFLVSPAPTKVSTHIPPDRVGANHPFPFLGDHRLRGPLRGNNRRVLLRRMLENAKGVLGNDWALWRFEAVL